MNEQNINNGMNGGPGMPPPPPQGYMNMNGGPGMPPPPPQGYMLSLIHISEPTRPY